MSNYILRRETNRTEAERRRSTESYSEEVEEETEGKDSDSDTSEEGSDSSYTLKDESEEGSEKRKDWITCKTCIQTSSIHHRAHTYNANCAISKEFNALTEAQQQPLLKRLKEERDVFLRLNRSRYPYGTPRAAAKYPVGAGFDTSPESNLRRNNQQQPMSGGGVFALYVPLGPV